MTRLASVAAATWLAACSAAPQELEVLSRSSTAVTVRASGYTGACTQPARSVRSAEGWVPVEDARSTWEEAVYVDSTFWEGSRCAYACVPLDSLTVSLVRYVDSGERRSAPVGSMWVGPIRVLLPVPIQGRLRVTLEAYNDADCTRASPIDGVVDAL